MDHTTKQQIVEALAGSQIGAIVACALGIETPAPRFTSKAIITSDGYVQANFVDMHGISRHSAFVGSYDELKESLRNVCKYLRAAKIINADQEHVLFNAVAFDWIADDYRALSAKN